MLKAFSLLLLIGSATLIILGLGSSQLLGSGISRMFAGVDPNYSILMIAGGVLLFISGVMGMLRVYGRSSGKKISPQGGIVPHDEEFSISVPASSTIKQGAGKSFPVSVNRGSYFKQDVGLAIKTEGITVTPANVMVKAGERSDVLFNIEVAEDAALGEYSIQVKGTPKTGESTSTKSTVTVVAK